MSTRDQWTAEQWREWHHAMELYALQCALRGVLDSAGPSISPPERVAVLTETLTSLLLDSLSWCERCQADHDSGLCNDHAAAVELSDSCRRSAYRQLPGHPRIDVDL